MYLCKIPMFLTEVKLGKNTISHLICDESYAIEYKYDDRILIVKTSFGDEIAFYKSDWIKKRNHKFIICCDKVPTIEKLINGDLKLSWVRHPKYFPSLIPETVVNSWTNSFQYIEESPNENIPGLRTPQIAAIHAALSHLKISNEISTIIMPTGTGKTETMLSIMIANKCPKILLTVPTDSLRDQLSKKFITLGILKKFGVVKNSALNPIVGVISESIKTEAEIIDFISKCNVIITTIQIASGSLPSVKKIMAKEFSHYFIDEAHHIKADTWSEFSSYFNERQIIQFTATPFRNDGQRLDGKIIFNYSLKKAQQDGYFTKINFIPISEYSPEKSDKCIADKAISILKDNIEKGYSSHILMARCENKKRADSVYEYYKDYSKYNPIKIYSGMSSSERKRIISQINNKNTNIIVCVDMLGEGFDLPELKIAAFHDIKKSLPVTLQLAGRFTRTKYDEELGSATFIANIADTHVISELEELYAQDADWNALLPQLSKDRIDEEIDFTDFINGFSNIENSLISLQNIRPDLSTVIYRYKNEKWHPDNFITGLHLKKDDLVIHKINPSENILILITAKKLDIEWGKFKDIQNTQWDLILVYRDIKSKLLFIHSSDNSSLYSELAHRVMGEKVTLVDKIDVFKAYYGLNRVRLQNVGLKEYLNKNIRFRMSVGTDVAEALSLAEKQKAQKAFVYGIGYENGEKVSLGCSYKGRIWTRLNGNLKEFVSWCTKIGNKIINPDIDPNMLLKETLIPVLVADIPTKKPVWIDWNEQNYLDFETKTKFIFDGDNFDFFNCELKLDYETELGTICFTLVSNSKDLCKLELKLFNENELANFTFNIVETKYKHLKVSYGKNEDDIIKYFKKFEPTIWFIDGSSLCGNEYVELKQQISPYPRDLIQVWDWKDISIQKESQGVYPKITDSIQYHVITLLKRYDYDVIYDDDNSGEIADIVAIKQMEKHIKIDLYHLKYAKSGKVSTRIDNLYEVCGQAQKSIQWKFKESHELFDHLLRRETKNENGYSCSRIEKGTKENLIYLNQIAKRNFPILFEIYIVQPGINPDMASPDQLLLLSVTENYIKEFSAIPLNIIGNSRTE